MDDGECYDAQIVAQHQGGPPVEIIDEVGARGTLHSQEAPQSQSQTCASL